MRRRSFALLLALLLISAQHGAVRHALAHLAHTGHTAGATLDAMPAADAAVCAACEAFTPVANPAGSASATAIAPRARPCLSPLPQRALAAAATLTPRSRGPPSA